MHLHSENNKKYLFNVIEVIAAYSIVSQKPSFCLCFRYRKILISLHFFSKLNVLRKIWNYARKSKK